MSFLDYASGATDPFANDNTPSEIYGLSGGLASVPVNLEPGDVIPAHPSGLGPVGPTTTPATTTQTAEQAMAHPFGMNHSDLSQLQRKLWDAGAMPKAVYTQGYTPGIMTSGDETDVAWKKVVETAMAEKKSPGQILQERAKAIADQGGLDEVGLGGKGPKGQRIIGGVDLMHYGQQAARELIGHDMDPQQLQAFTDKYLTNARADETSYERAARGPAAAEAFLKAQDPNEIQAQRMVGLFQLFSDHIKGGTSTAGQTPGAGVQ
jgi:pyruvate/2-oxoglutarate dehydrogenase complex dihydrolipoamide acyltransferase (E2) component